MAIAIKNALIDGQLSFEKGVDTYPSPARVPRNQSCLLVNNTTRSDFVGPRPGWRQIPLTFADTADETAEQIQAAFEDGYYQGVTGYIPDSGPSHMVWSISGQLFRTQLAGNTQKIVLPPGITGPTNRPRVWFCQGEIFLVIQDGQSRPLFYWGGGIRQSDVAGTGGTDPDGKPMTEIPVGTCMAYSGGRLWVTLPDGRSFIAGDGVYGPTGTAAFQQRDAILRTTENNYLSGGFPFAVPSNMGPITAMVPLANLDTSLGQGPLQIFTHSGSFSVQAPFDRALWAVMTDPIKTVSLLDNGALSDNGVTLVNGDAWYRALDGVRSFMIARRDFGTWGNKPMSSEVTRHLKDDDQALLSHCSSALCDNRLLVTCSPERNQEHGILHRGLVVLDFLPLSSLQSAESPSWEGLWIGFDILKVFNVPSQGISHTYAAVLAPEDENGMRKIQLWELTQTLGKDVDENNASRRIARAIETPRFDFSNKLEQKLLEACEVWCSDVRGTVDFTLLYRPDDYPCFLPWKHWQVCAKIERCATDAIDGCLTGLNLKPQYRVRISGQRPPDAVIMGQPSRLGCGFQIRLEILGDCDVTAIRLLCNRLTESVFGTGLPGEATCEEIVCCGGSPLTPVEPPLAGLLTEGGTWITTESGVVIQAQNQP